MKVYYLFLLALLASFKPTNGRNDYFGQIRVQTMAHIPLSFNGEKIVEGGFVDSKWFPNNKPIEICLHNNDKNPTFFDINKPIKCTSVSFPPNSVVGFNIQYANDYDSGDDSKFIFYYVDEKSGKKHRDRLLFPEMTSAPWILHQHGKLHGTRIINAGNHDIKINGTKIAPHASMAVDSNMDYKVCKVREHCVKLSLDEGEQALIYPNFILMNQDNEWFVNAYHLEKIKE